MPDVVRKYFKHKNTIMDDALINFRDNVFPSLDEEDSTDSDTSTTSDTTSETGSEGELATSAPTMTTQSPEHPVDNDEYHDDNDSTDSSESLMDPIRERLSAPITQPQHESFTDLDTIQLTDDILSEIPITVDQDNETKHCARDPQRSNGTTNVVNTNKKRNTNQSSAHADHVQPSTKKEKLQH